MINLLMVMLLLAGSTVGYCVPAHGQRPRSRPSRQKPRTTPPVTSNKLATPLDQLFNATAELEAVWEYRNSSVLVPEEINSLFARADKIRETGLHAQTFVESNDVKKAISRMSTAYFDAVELHRFAVIINNGPLDTRADEVAELEARKKEWLNERDPVEKDRKWSTFKVMESLFKMKYGGDSKKWQLDEANRMRDRIDPLAKERLKAYGMEDQWSSAPTKTTEQIFSVATKTRVSIQKCLTQREYCETLSSETPTASKSLPPSTSPLVGDWKLTFVAANKRSELIFTIAQQNHSYRAAINETSGQVPFTAMDLSDRNFAFASNVPVNGYNMNISGRVDGDRMEGTIAMTDAGGGVYTVQFTGTRLSP